MELSQVLEALRNADAAGDEEAARRLAQIAQQLQAQQAAPKQPTEDTTGFKAAAAAGFERLKGEAALTAGKLGLMDTAAAEQYQKEKEAAAEKRFTPTQEGWTEAPWQKLKETAGGSLPYMVAPAAAGLATLAAPVSAPVAAALGAGAAGLTSAAQFTGTNLSRQMETGKSLEEADLGKAALAAIPQAALDTAAMALVPGVGKLFGSVGSKLTAEEAKAIASQTLGRTVADYAAATGKTMGREGLTESVQQVFERLQAGLSLTDPEARKEYIDNFIGGAALGAVAAPVGRAYERGEAKVQARKADEEEQAKLAAEAEAAKNTPEALRQLESNYQAAFAQVQALNKQVDAAKPGKGATEEQKAAYDELKKQRAAFVNDTFKPLKQEFDQRKDSIAKMYEDQQAALEAETGAAQPTAAAPVRNEEPNLDVQRLMDEQEQLRNQLGQLEAQLGQAAPEQFDALNQQRQDLQRRLEARAVLIEERGGTPLAQSAFQQATAAKMQAIDTRLEKLNSNYATALENKDYDAAAKAKDELLAAKQEREALTAKTAQQMQALQEQQTRAQQRGQTLDMFAEAPAPAETETDRQLRQQTLEEEAQRGMYGPKSTMEMAKQTYGTMETGPRGQLEPTTPMPEQVAKTGIKPKQLEAVETAKVDIDTAQTELADAVKTKDTGSIYAAMDKLNQAKNTEARAQEEVGRSLFRPAVLDIFSPANIINTAIQNNDTKLINDLAAHSDRTALREALDEKATERERLVNALETRLDLGGEDVAEKGGQPLRSIKRERADLFSKQYDPKQQALFKNGTYPDKELQKLYDEGGPAAVEYKNVMDEAEQLAKKVTTKQGNAKESLYERAVRQYATLEELKAQQESGIATPTLREKAAGLQAQLGKGEAPAPRQMDAAEKYQLQRKIDSAQKAYDMTIGQITPVRDRILSLHNSLYKTTKLEKPSVVTERKQREADAAARGPKAMSKTAKTAARIARGDVRKEAETSENMRSLASELGKQEAAYEQARKDFARRLKALYDKYGKDDSKSLQFLASAQKDLQELAVKLGKKTPEYKATLKEQIELTKEALSQSKQAVPTQRTTQVTRKQSAAPKRLVSSSPESKATSAREQETYAKYRGSLKDAQEAVASEKEGREEERFLRGVETESLELDNTTVSLLQQNDVRSALTRISADKRVDDFSRAVAKTLATFLDATKVKLYDDLRDSNGKQVLGAATSKLIELNRNGGLSVETLLHEATHAAAERVVQLSETSPNQLSKEQRIAVQELKAIHARVKADPKITSANAKSSLSEFVAEVMSNRNLQKQLAERKWRMSDMWEGIKSVIMRMLGLDKVETMFGASVVSVEQLFVPSSKRNLGGGKETRVTRKLSAKDIAALHDGSNSMKQFADQFGPLIKQKDRTAEDVERIATGVIKEMIDSVGLYSRYGGTPLEERADKSVVALPTADTLDYKAMATMSDGKPYDENNPLHYVEAEPATFAALKALNDPALRRREAEEIASQRRSDFLSLATYFTDNYENYTAAETALVLKAAAKYGVISDRSGKLKLVEIGKDNRHNIAVVGKDTADAVIEQLRAGKNLKQAFLDGLQKNADANAKSNERKNGWKKFDQATADYAPNAYTNKEVDAAIAEAGLTDADVRENGWDKEAAIQWLIENGYLEDRTGGKKLEEAAIALNAGAAGTPWCTGASVSTARSQIERGDFYIYYKNGRPEVAVRMDGADRIGEVRGNNPNQALDSEQQSLAENFLRSKGFSNADEYVDEFARKARLESIAKGKTEISVDDLLDSRASFLNNRGEPASDSSVERALSFRTIDGYGNRPEPSKAVRDFFVDKYREAATKAYADNKFVFSEVSLKPDNEPVQIEFAGKTYTATNDTIKAAKTLNISVYGTRSEQEVVAPKLERINRLNIFRGVGTFPAMRSIKEITFFHGGSFGESVVNLPTDTRVGTVAGYDKHAHAILNGPRTVGAVVLRHGRGGLFIDMPNTAFAVVDNGGAEVADTFAYEATKPVADKLDKAGLTWSQLRAFYRGDAPEADVFAINDIVEGPLREFFTALREDFGTAAYDKVFENTDIANAYDASNYEKSVRMAIEQLLENEGYTQEAFDKMATLIKYVTGADVAYPKAELIAPNLIADAPYGKEFEEAPEERRFAPAAVGVQGNEKEGFSFLRKKPVVDSVVGQEPGVVDNLLGNFLGLRGRVQFIDQYAALEAATKQGLSKGMISSLEATNANYLLRFGQQRSQFAGQFLTNGPVRVEHTKKAGGVETVYRSVKGTSMMDVAQALNKAKLGTDVEQENMFTMYIAGKRAAQVGWDKLNFSSPAKAKAEYEAVMSRLNGSPEAKAAFEEAAKLYQKYNAGLLDFLVDTGALSASKAAELKSISYVPFYRINGNGEVQLMIDKEHPIRISNIKDQPQLKELVGGNTAILPIFTSATQNTFMITGMGLRNQAVKETAFMLRKLGIASRVAEGKGPAGPDVVRFFKNGKEHYAVIDTDQYGIPAELIVRGMEGIKTTLPAVIKAMALPANILRSFVVRNPAYAVRQVIRDPLNAWLTTGTDAAPVLSSMKELATMVAGRSEAERKLMETGAISSNIYSGDQQDMSRFLKDLSVGRPMWEKALGKLDALALQGDAATRAVIYKDSLAKGMTEQEALLRTLESMNFSRRGVSPSMQALSIMIPFFNAQIQGLDVIYRAMKGDMPFSEQLAIREKMVRRGLLLAAGTIAYAAMMEDDEAYKRARPQERYANWFVYVPGIDEPVRVPIPFEMGFLFKALPEAVWNVAMQDDQASKAAKGIGALAMQTIPFSLPQAIKPVTEAVLGKSFYGGDIESQREKEMLATERYRDSTTEIAKMIGAVTGNVGVSPIMVDHLIRGYTSGLGVAIVQLANPILASDTRAEVQQPTTKISKQPFIGGLFQPVEGRGTLDEAYDRMQEIRQTKGTYNKLVEEGKRAEAQAFAQEYSTKLAAMSTSGSVQKRLGELAKVERQIKAHPTMTTAEKDAKLEQIDKAKIALARQFLAVTQR